MSRKYTKMLCLIEEVFRLKEEGKTNREIGEIYGLTKEQVKQLEGLKGCEAHSTVILASTDEKCSKSLA